MYELKKKMKRYLRVNLLGPGPRLMKKEFTGPRSHKVKNTGLELDKNLTLFTEYGNVSFPKWPLVFGMRGGPTKS